MKRRHRLAEVLLSILPYEGNDHETACRLEHAIDDDMEVALSRLITVDTKDPSGREIPEPTPDIAARLSTRSSLISLLDLEENRPATVAAMFMPAEETSAMEQGGFGVGAQIVRTGEDSFSSNGQTAQLSETWMKGVFVDISNDIV